MKRRFDLVFATVLLVIWSPVIFLAALVIRLTSPGPAFFRHTRVGRNGREFQVLKLRTMVHENSGAGPGVTRHGDCRITPIGRLLRKWKIDELPQFINVVRGEMSLVGPRPDLGRYFARLTDEERRILQVTPGITSPATLAFCDEEALLAPVDESGLEEFYCRVILPRKIQLDLQYALNATFATDVKVLLATATAIVRRRNAVSACA